MRAEATAAAQRKRIPVWALPVLLALPLWAYVYRETLEPPPADGTTPLALGEAQYRSCAMCHGADGGGSSNAPALTEVVETWPDPRDHMAWVRLGSVAWPGDTYGATDRPKHPGMPPHPGLSDAELAQVVLYERVAFGGLDEGSEALLVLEQVARGETTFADAGLGPEAEASGVDPAVLVG